MKKIAVGDLGEFWYGDYKEPFEQLEGAVPGHPVGVVLKADDGKLLCAYCGKVFDDLGQHANKTHKLPAREYKQEVGLLQKSALVSEAVRQKRIAHALRFLKSSPATFRPGRKGESHPSAKNRNGMRAPELRNKRGTCYAQLMATARSIKARKGRVTLRDLAAVAIHPVTIEQYYPSVGEFFAALDTPDTRHGPKMTDLELLGVLHSLAMTIGQTPSKSDLARYGLPMATTYRRRFGSYASACRAAGLDPNLPRADGSDFALQVLTSYATLGSIGKTTAHLHISQHRVERVFAAYGAPFAINTPGGRDSSARKEWAAEMARRLAA